MMLSNAPHPLLPARPRPKRVIDNQDGVLSYSTPFVLIRGEAMNLKPDVLQLKLIGDDAKESNGDLVGRSFYDGQSDVRVTGVCRLRPAHLIVARDSDGRSWIVPAGLIRLIVGRERRKRTA
ncbi:MAG: hypothetical protein M3458_04295 [Acidobacteriota bacterium]|nr:hypothetical protein [Acidobacteriota bacterium]